MLSLIFVLGQIIIKKLSYKTDIVPWSSSSSSHDPALHGVSALCHQEKGFPTPALVPYSDFLSCAMTFSLSTLNPFAGPGSVLASGITTVSSFS